MMLSIFLHNAACILRSNVSTSNLIVEDIAQEPRTLPWLCPQRPPDCARLSGCFCKSSIQRLDADAGWMMDDNGLMMEDDDDDAGWMMMMLES